jgi:hypothetical protein
MNKLLRDLVLVFVGIIVGAGCAMLATHERTSSKNFASSTDSTTKVPCVYCIKDVHEGEVVTRQALAVKNIDIAELPPDTVQDVWVAVGRKPNCRLDRGMILNLHYFNLALK